LCQLNLPCHTKIHSRRTSSKHNSVSLMGGECKEQGHVHCYLVQNNDYGFQLHEALEQTAS